MVVSTLGSPARLLHNVSDRENHWIVLKLVGTKSNRLGLGAKVRLTAADGTVQWNHATTAVGYACASDSRVHFGLGTNRRVTQIEIRWPSGARQILGETAGDRIVTVEEPLELAAGEELL